MAFYENMGTNETRCQINEISDYECNEPTERDIITEGITLHICATHYNEALMLVGQWCGFCRGKCKGQHYVSPSTEGY